MRGVAVCLAIACSHPQPISAAPRWNFCVASSKGGADVWITGVFAAVRDRAELESAFRAAVERLGAANPDAQCPLPVEDKTEAVNAQFKAEEFNRSLGATLHAAPASEFLPPR